MANSFERELNLLPERMLEMRLLACSGENAGVDTVTGAQTQASALIWQINPPCQLAGLAGSTGVSVWRLLHWTGDAPKPGSITGRLWKLQAFWKRSERGAFGPGGNLRVH